MKYCKVKSYIIHITYNISWHIIYNLYKDREHVVFQDWKRCLHVFIMQMLKNKCGNSKSLNIYQFYIRMCMDHFWTYGQSRRRKVELKLEDLVDNRAVSNIFRLSDISVQNLLDKAIQTNFSQWSKWRWIGYFESPRRASNFSFFYSYTFYYIFY